MQLLDRSYDSKGAMLLQHPEVDKKKSVMAGLLDQLEAYNEAMSMKHYVN